jgi:transcriptional regulator with XRE-family HTH domain
MGEGFGDLLRGFRVAASLTQEELAEPCRISPATVAALEQGRRRAPRLSTVRLIGGALELPAIELAALATAASSASLATSARGSQGRTGAGAPGSQPGSSLRSGALPVPITRLFGRAAQAAAVAQTVCSERLVTLTGPGGVGKTRLALQVARDTLDKFAGGTRWVELGPVTGPGGLRDAVLRSLGAGDQPGAASPGQLVAAMPSEPALLVLDNCEHVLDAVATMIGALLARSPVTAFGARLPGRSRHSGMKSAGETRHCAPGRRGIPSCCGGECLWSEANHELAFLFRAARAEGKAGGGRQRRPDGYLLGRTRR